MCARARAYKNANKEPNVCPARPTYKLKGILDIPPGVSQEWLENYYRHLSHVRYIRTAEGRRQLIHEGIVKYMEKEHKKKRKTDDTPPVSSLDEDAQPRTQIRRRVSANSIMEAYDDKIMMLTMRLGQLEDTVTANRDTIKKLSARVDSLERGVRTDASVAPICHPVLANASSPKNGGSQPSRADLKKRVDEYKEFCASFFEPYCVKCHMDGHECQ